MRFKGTEGDKEGYELPQYLNNYSCYRFSFVSFFSNSSMFVILVSYCYEAMILFWISSIPLSFKLVSVIDTFSGMIVIYCVFLDLQISFLSPCLIWIQAPIGGCPVCFYIDAEVYLFLPCCFSSYINWIVCDRIHADWSVSCPPSAWTAEDERQRGQWTTPAGNGSQHVQSQFLHYAFKIFLIVSIGIRSSKKQ